MGLAWKRVVSKVKNENSLKEDFLGIGGVYWALGGLGRERKEIWVSTKQTLQGPGPL